MADAKTANGSERLFHLIKGGYWAALLIIAAMAMASFVLLQQMMGAHQRDSDLLTLASAQKALSQRIVFLASVASHADAGDKTALVESLAEATEEFESNYDRLLAFVPEEEEASGEGALGPIFFAAPHHLDYFSTSLAANGRRLVAALRRQIAPDEATGPEAGLERANMDEVVAGASLAGYRALEESISTSAQTRLSRMLAMHRMLFYATIAIIVLVALLIFRPLADLIRRRTGELVEARNSMAYIAVHDGLTGLHNRTFLRDHFGALIRAAQRRDERIAVFQLDLDRFKQINDTLGHAAGDFVLVNTAERMRESCRASDVCIRLGGDEFVMILNGAGTSEDIEMVAKRILSKINEPMSFGGATILPGASAGIAVYPVDADNPEDLLVHADLALYASKKLGGGAFSFFSDELRAELDHRKLMENDLKAAIREEAFSVHFQPQVSLSNGAITGVEALVRWMHPERGMIAPSEFIPVAEKAALMAPIGRIVMRKAIAAASQWYREGIVFGRLAVNVSGTELRETDFQAFLFRTLEEAGLPPQKLSLEIVESVILDDEKTGIAAKLRAIRAAGVHLELDDFGTGYASLSHVNPNEIDRLKIDRRFVQNINANGDNTKIVRAITELARGLGISIIAEGAETDAELSSLLTIGCEEVQGYSIAFPMPDGQAREWLAARTPKKPVLQLHRGSMA